MQVTLPTGKTYLLVIDTTAYSGNFERELCAFTTGLFSEEMLHGEDEAQDAIRVGGEIVARIMAKSSPLVDNENGTLVVETIRATPGRCNDGLGRHMDADTAAASTATYPAYESIAVLLSEPLDEEEMAFVRGRAEEFAARPPEHCGAPFAIRDIYQIESIQQTAERRL